MLRFGVKEHYWRIHTMALLNDIDDLIIKDRGSKDVVPEPLRIPAPPPPPPPIRKKKQDKQKKKSVIIIDI